MLESHCWVVSEACFPSAFAIDWIEAGLDFQNKFNNLDIDEDELIIGDDDYEQNNHSWPNPSESVTNYKPPPIVIANAPQIQ
ncbi:hypothetical protein NPIL_69841 [Nephila pilipes]|uniref:Uncharacterized protein n=1 Tax=Nephila pilipes TaxID=299642 RepID=A0A8X6U4I2_NEPPI|nr:hypothetical protein NPIL_69841 [Nephila pilipes]